MERGNGVSSIPREYLQLVTETWHTGFLLDLGIEFVNLLIGRVSVVPPLSVLWRVWDRPGNKWWNKDISGLFTVFVLSNKSCKQTRLVDNRSSVSPVLVTIREICRTILLLLVSPGGGGVFLPSHNNKIHDTHTGRPLSHHWNKKWNELIHS